jgi:hypothetical protein
MILRLLKGRRMVSGFLERNGMPSRLIPPHLKHCNIPITRSVKKISVPHSRRTSHGGIIITSGLEEIPIPNSRK